jgi:hypothetical protein
MHIPARHGGGAGCGRVGGRTFSKTRKKRLHGSPIDALHFDLKDERIRPVRQDFRSGNERHHACNCRYWIRNSKRSDQQFQCRLDYPAPTLIAKRAPLPGPFSRQISRVFGAAATAGDRTRFRARVAGSGICTTGPFKSLKLATFIDAPASARSWRFCQCGKNSPYTRHIPGRFPKTNRHPRLLSPRAREGAPVAARSLGALPGRTGFDGAGVHRYQVAS